MKPIGKSTICFAMIMVIVLSMTACGAQPRADADGVSSAPTQSAPAAESTAPTDATVETVPNSTTEATETPSALMTEDEAIAASKRLFEQIREFAGKDYEAFAALYRNTPEEAVRSDYEFNWEIYDQYDKENYVVVGRNENVFFVNITNYIVAGQHPNTSMEYNSLNLVISYETGAWKIDCSNETKNSIDISGIYPQECIEANKLGRNAAEFAAYNRMFVDEKAVYEGHSQCEVKFAWQDAEGNLYVSVWLANGTNQNLAYTTYEITLTNNDSQLIASLSGDINEIVKANSSRLVTLMLTADDVVSGMNTWGAVSTNTRIYFK